MYLRVVMKGDNTAYLFCYTERITVFQCFPLYYSIQRNIVSEIFLITMKITIGNNIKNDI